MAFLQSPLYDFFRMQDKSGNSQMNYDVAFAYSQDLTDILEADLKWRYTPKLKGEKRPTRNVVVDIRSFAASGSGKSTIGLITLWKIAKISGMTLNPKRHIHFSIATLVNGLKDAKPNEVFMLDEQRAGESMGSGSMGYFARLSDIINISRAMGLGIITVGIPELAFLNYDPHFRFHAEAIDMDTDSSLFLIADKDNCFRGYATMQKPHEKEFQQFEAAYTKHKMAFIQENLIGIFKNKFVEREKKSKELAKNSKFWQAQNNDERVWIFEEMFGEEIPMSEQQLIIKHAFYLFRTEHPEFFNGKGKVEFGLLQQYLDGDVDDDEFADAKKKQNTKLIRKKKKPKDIDFSEDD
jgi:hypothetical protein